MPALFVAAAAAFLLCLIFTPPVRRLARPQGWRRQETPGRSNPDTERVPRMGGIAVWLAVAGSLAATWWWRLPISFELVRQVHPRALAGPLALVILAGVIDDRFGLRARYKLAAELAAAIWVATSGIRVTALFFHQLPLWLSVLSTAGWLIVCTNAFNLIDGLDGLATGLALFADATLLAHAVLSGQPALALLTGALFGALAGFLVFNFPPATVYLGDAGSLSIGFFLGCVALLWFDKATTAVGLLAPMFALLVPIADTVVALVRRGLGGVPIFAPDRDHVHHKILKLGLTPRTATLALYGVAIAGAVLALVLEDIRRRETFELVILLFVALAVFGIQRLGYIEFAEAGRMFRRGIFEHTKIIHAHVSLRRFCEDAAAAPGFVEIGERLRSLADELGFAAVELRAGPAAAPAWIRRYDLAPEPPANAWIMAVPLGPLGETGMARFWCAFDHGNPVFMHELAAALDQVLPARLAALLPAAAGATAR